MSRRMYSDNQIKRIVESSSPQVKPIYMYNVSFGLSDTIECQFRFVTNNNLTVEEEAEPSDAIMSLLNVNTQNAAIPCFYLDNNIDSFGHAGSLVYNYGQSGSALIMAGDTERLIRKADISSLTLDKVNLITGEIDTWEI